MVGTVFGVGVGPGDPELLTMKAHRLISTAKVVAYPAPLGGDSFARSIAQSVINDTAEEIRIDIPMDAARFPAQEVYDAAAGRIASRLRGGHDVVVLCEGDPLFYGSFMYLLARLAPDFSIEVVPGVTSVTACAAASIRPLSARNEVLTIVPGTLDQDELEAQISAADALAIMKVGRHLPKIRKVIEKLRLTKNAHYIERASLPNEKVMALADAPAEAPYFSMILVNKGGDPWLS